ncbi:MAG: glycosyltransferase family 4 protein [Patescibacteria group bacterium]
MSKICIDIRALLDEPRSGVGEYTHTLLHELINVQHEHEFVLFFSGRKKSKTIKSLQLAFKDNPKVTWYHLKWPNKVINMLWFMQLGPCIDELTNTTQVWMPNYNFVRISARARLLITCHDISYKLLPHVFSKKGRFWHWVVNPMRLYRRADVVIAVSKQTKNDLRMSGIDERKIQVAYPLLPKIKIDVSDQEVQVEQGAFLYIGTLDPRKNILGVLEGYVRYTQLVSLPRPLYIAGRLGWHEKGYYKQITNIISNCSSVKYIGYMPENEKGKSLQNARACLFASLYEGFGFPPLEAMQMNCPVIASSVGSLPEVIGTGAYYVDPYDAESIARSFLVLDTNEEVYKNLISEGEKVIDFWTQQRDISLKKVLSLL